MNEVVNTYKGWYEQFGDSPKSLGWGGEAGQQIRFRQMIRIADFLHKSIIDVGCGFGDLASYLEQNGQAPAQYTGVDVVDEYISICKRKHQSKTNREFYLADFIDFPVPVKPDWVVCSGSLNAGVTFETAVRIVNKMWDSAGTGIIFNLENNYGIPEESRVQLYDPLYWIDHVHRHFSNKVVYLSDYHRCDFTIGVFR